VPLTIALFFTMRPERALLFSVLGSMLFLPEAIDFKFPLLPPLSKHNIPYVCALVCCAVRAPRQVFSLPKERWFFWLCVLLLAGAIAMALTNGDPLRYGKWHKVTLPPLTVKDGLFTGVDQGIHAAVPFFLGLLLFRTSKQLSDLLAAFAIAAVIYLPLTAVELRMSPQFHYWVYGYQHHSFLQTMRFGGYRPMVFMPHGLALGRFLAVASMSALVVAPVRKTLLGIPSRVVSGVLFVTLVLCKSTGAIVYGAIGLAVALVERVRPRLALAVVLGTVVLLYPVIRAADVFPVNQVVAAAGVFGADRQQSLTFRFENEEGLLAKARQRIVFGWGEYNRAAMFDDMGRPSVSDGHWIILFGILGAAGFVCAFGILLIPIFVARSRLRYIHEPGDRLLVAGVSMIIGLVAFDLLPNGLWDDYPYLMAGALMGVTRALVTAEERVRVTLERTAVDLQPVSPM
jgi:hypothetical protein